MTIQALFSRHIAFWIILGFVLGYCHVPAISQTETPSETTVRFSVTTYDGLELPAQVLMSPEPDSKMIVFLFGSTPYDERGNQWAGWDADGNLISQRQRFYSRFLEVMSAKGYNIATMAKRSFVYSHARPRPSLDELALDVQFLIWELKKRELVSPESLYVVGYSEGSTVATKVVGLLKQQPAGCVLLGSGSSDFNFKTQSWEEWYMVDAIRRIRGWSDEQIQKEYHEFGALAREMLTIDEERFENEWKKNGAPFGYGLAPWESIHIDREAQFYDATANLLTANIPTLIVIGENDLAMPMVLARRTYERLVTNGFEKATFRVIEDEVHQYKKYDVYAIIDAWIKTNGQSADVAFDELDKSLIDKYALSDDIAESISQLPWKGEGERALECFERAKEAGYDDANSWFKLGLVLFDNALYPESLSAFEEASHPTFLARFASLVWIGHIKDLQNKREEAIESYKEALEVWPGFPVQHDQYGIVIDGSWIEARLENPFTGVANGGE